MTSYEIRVKGHLDGRRSECFDGLTNANLQDGVAVLNKVRNLNLPLVSVTNVNLDQQEPATGPAKHGSDRPREHYIKEGMMTTQNQSGGPSQHRLARQVGGRKWLS